jgi:hypothetical protein
LQVRELPGTRTETAPSGRRNAETPKRAGRDAENRHRANQRRSEGDRMTEQLDPFRDPLIAVDNGGPLDAVEAWERETKRINYVRNPAALDLAAAGDRLAAELVRVRAMVAAMEAECAQMELGDLQNLVDARVEAYDHQVQEHQRGQIAELRALVERAVPLVDCDDPEYPEARTEYIAWHADAERVLAAGTGEDDRG